MAERALAVDIGGTKVAAGVVHGDGVLTDRLELDTPQDSAEATFEAVIAAVDAVGEVGAGLPVGIGAAGLIDHSGVVRFAPNLPWTDYPLLDRLRDRLGRPVALENDANAAAWGEYLVGAARDATQTVVMLTVGTGIGGGLIVDGRLLRGAEGLAAEFGHMLVAEGARRCPCGNHGCLEAMASGTAIGRTAGEWVAAGRVPADSVLRGCAEPTGAEVGRAAQEGDRAAVEVVAECGRWLGVGMASLVNALDPEILVVAGGAAALGDLLLTPAAEALEERVTGRVHRVVPPVVVGTLGADAGLFGAGLLALDRHSGDPEGGAGVDSAFHTRQWG